jgi:hypothetical protein
MKINETTDCEIRGSHGGEDGDVVLLGYDAM